MRKKLILTYVDSLRTDMLELAVRSGEAPTFGRLIERGNLIPDCVSSFPSVTPVACAEMVTGKRSDEHFISGMNWYHRLEQRYVEYGSSLEATRAFGIFRCLYDLVYNMNLAHLSPDIETIFESLDDADLRTACTPYLIYRGRHRHEVSLDGLMKRAVDATRLKFHHHTWGPTELFYGDLYSSRPVPCKPTSIPGNRDGYSACCASELAGANLFDFLLFSLPDNDNFSHRHGPEATVTSIAKADRCLAELAAAAGGFDGFLTDYAVILLADHAHTPVQHSLEIAGLLGERWKVLQPSEDQPELAQLAVSPTARAAHVYLLTPPEGPGPDHEEVRAEIAQMEGVDLTCWLVDQDGSPVVRRTPGIPITAGLHVVIERAGTQIRFRPGGDVVDLRRDSWDVSGDLGTLEATIADGVFSSDEYPDPLQRVWSALCAPHSGDIVISASLGYECADWGGVAHVGGGSHGSLHRADSEGPLLFVGCGPENPSEKKQWALADVGDVVLEHFGIENSDRNALRS